MTPTRALDRLIVLTLAIETSIAEECFDALTPLLDERLRCIEILESCEAEPSWTAKLSALRKVEDRVVGKLADVRAQTAQTLAADARGLTNARRFTSPGPNLEGLQA